MEFLVAALIVLALTIIFVWGTIDVRFEPPTRMEYHGMGWQNVPQYRHLYGSEHFEWSWVFKGAGFFAAAFGSYWLYEFWLTGFLSFVTWIGMLVFLVLAYWYVIRAVENRFVRPHPDGAVVQRPSRKLAGRIVFLVLLLSVTATYILLGAPWFPWPELLTELGLAA